MLPNACWRSWQATATCLRRNRPQTLPRERPRWLRRRSRRRNPKLASQAFAYGVPAFFSHDPVAQAQAFEQFRAAVKYDPDDPVYRYFLALTLFGQGRLPEASAQAYAAVKRESGQYDRQRVARSLERVQGPTRAWLEEIRVNALLRP